MVFRNSALLTSWYGSLSHYLHGFSAIPGGAGFLPSTVLLFVVWQKKKALPGPNETKTEFQGSFLSLGWFSARKGSFGAVGGVGRGIPKNHHWTPTLVNCIVIYSNVIWLYGLELVYDHGSPDPKEGSHLLQQWPRPFKNVYTPEIQSNGYFTKTMHIIFLPFVNQHEPFPNKQNLPTQEKVLSLKLIARPWK